MLITPTELIQSYYDAFNRKDMNAFLDCLTDDVKHDINQGGTEYGKEAFRKFMEHMNNCYDEQVTDLVILTNSGTAYAGAHFNVSGIYLKTDGDLPPATGQKYQLPVSAYFEIHADKISHVATYYNLKEWIEIIKRG